DELLKHLGQNLRRQKLGQRDLTHEEVVNLAGNDRLRIAEYYYLTQGKQVGPLRREIERQFANDSPLSFGGYIDLVNLGAQRIYTTNFDDLIERTYGELDLPFEMIATPRDLALSTGSETEIVKYHGDLTNDPSLVLTESQYHRRLNFESPMDLKFRADLLGKSVMFVGYSFSDMNIRIIWFRLLDMMRGVDQKDLPTSYMVIVKPNQVEELLYEDAGIETVVLDPTGECKEEDYPALVGDFLYELAGRVCDPQIPGSDDRPFVSGTLLRHARSSLGGNQRRSSYQRSVHMRRLSRYRLPVQYEREALKLFTSDTIVTRDSVEAAVTLHSRFPRETDIGLFLQRSALTRQGMTVQDNRRVNWGAIEQLDIGADARKAILKKADEELEYHDGGFDHELFFASYLVGDLAEGKFGASSEEREKGSWQHCSRC
ncbi:MAG: SIR2 family protein, partial [Gemmatimonadetes bacterium]|nr:SIR2 family protein [Gemmatimonadota bacterium]